MSPRHAGVKDTWRSRIASRMFRIVTPERAKVAAIFAGVLALIFILYTSAITLKNQNQVNKERADRIKETNAALCDIIGIIPPGLPQIDSARAQFNCGPYSLSRDNSAKPGSPIDKAIRSNHPRATRSLAPPGASRSPAPPGAQASATPTPGATRTVFNGGGGPAPTPVPPHTRTATRTVTAHPMPPSTAGILPIPGCSINLLGIKAC